MTKKLKIFGMSNQDTGVYWYRVKQPLNFIAKQKLAQVHSLPFFGQHAQHLTTSEFTEYYAKEGKWADVLMTTCATNREYLALVMAMRDRYKLKLVVDLDDDVLSTIYEPNNPAYQAYLQPNARFAEYAQFCLKEADLVTVSTEYLKKKYESINPNIVVIKNCIDPVLFKGKNQPDGLTLGYAGSGSHQADWNMIEPVLQKMKHNHGAKVKLLGPMYTEIADEKVSWIDMLKYPKALKDMGFAIGLAPLKDSMMNRAKSNLRWLEYSAYGIPTIASDVVPFREMENVIRVSEPEEWKTAIESLLRDPAKRTTLGLAAYNEMKANYDPSHWSRELYTAIESLF